MADFGCRPIFKMADGHFRLISSSKFQTLSLKLQCSTLCSIFNSSIFNMKHTHYSLSWLWSVLSVSQVHYMYDTMYIHFQYVDTNSTSHFQNPQTTNIICFSLCFLSNLKFDSTLYNSVYSLSLNVHDTLWDSSLKTQNFYFSFVHCVIFLSNLKVFHNLYVTN